MTYLERSVTAGTVPNIHVDWSSFGRFDARVLKSLMSVPAGETRTYSELARQCGSPRAARAVGNALNRNPIPVVIPCHRVLRKDGSLGGFSCGVRWKKLLLRLESSKSSLRGAQRRQSVKRRSAARSSGTDRSDRRSNHSTEIATVAFGDLATLRGLPRPPAAGSSARGRIRRLLRQRTHPSAFWRSGGQ